MDERQLVLVIYALSCKAFIVLAVRSLHTLLFAVGCRGARTLGSVAAGKIADLLMLDADPLVDINNSQRIRAVFLDGLFLDRDALDALVATAEEAAGCRSIE